MARLGRSYRDDKEKGERREEGSEERGRASQAKESHRATQPCKQLTIGTRGRLFCLARGTTQKSAHASAQPWSTHTARRSPSHY